MLIIPLPPTLLDFFITMNISGGLMIVVTSMYLNSALEFSAFPSLLLLTTMFRLAINISVTRQILSTGNAGSVVKAFGQFVVNGNVVIGLVICALGVTEVTGREHFAGYRSHTALLAAVPTVVLEAIVVGVFGDPSDRAWLLLLVIPVYALLFFPLRHRFRVARQARAAQAARASAPRVG